MDVDDEVPGKAPALSEAEASRVLADSGSSAEAKERALLSLARHLAAAKNGPGLRGLLARAEPFFAQVPKVRTARIVRALIDEVGSVPGAERVQAELCLEAVDWCVREGRTFLRLRIATQLAAVFLQVGDFKRAIRVVERTVREVKKLDDKALLVEVHLIESRVHHRLRNVPKSKGALTSARSAANAIYCPPKLQASIDQMAGVLSAEERDYKTGYSYFFEAFEGFNQLKQREDAVLALKYMLLMKIMGDAAADVQAIVHGRSGLEYRGREVASMVAVADAHRDRSVHAYRRALEDFKDQLVDDPVVHAHLSQLYENLLEQNLLRIVGPYSRVQISHVARSINLPLPDVEQKLSQMVLDGRLRGVLEQGSGDLIIFEPTEEDTTYTIALDTMKELNGALDRLNAKARGLR